jgi:hypothetical protein
MIYEQLDFKGDNKICTYFTPSEESASVISFEITAAGGYILATLCIKAVVDDERKSPSARRRSP